MNDCEDADVWSDVHRVRGYSNGGASQSELKRNGFRQDGWWRVEQWGKRREC